jgi:hypothetical protein
MHIILYSESLKEGDHSEDLDVDRKIYRGFESRQGLRIFLFTTVSRPALGPTQLPIQWVPEGLYLGLKRHGSEADHSPPSSAEVKNA